MIRWTIAGLFLLITAFRPPCKAQGRHNIMGSWVSKPYYETLKSTKSPLAAFNSNTWGIPVMQIVPYHGQLLIQWSNNFSDGEGFELEDFHKTSDSSTYEFLGEEYHGRELQNEFILDSDTALQWDARLVFGDSVYHVSLTFLKMEEPIDSLVNQLAISGRYVDAAGNVYKFEDSGLATWPNSSFRYAVQYDYNLFDGCDYLMNLSDSSTSYKFKWLGSKLALFKGLPPNEHQPEILRFESVPFVILRRAQ